MSSKKNLSLILSAVLLVTSCTPKVGEAPPDPPQQKLNGTQCLSSLQPVIEAFIAGDATDDAVASGWDCASMAMGKFKKYVYGREADRFEATELADFLKNNFLSPSSPEITPELQLEVMRVKQLFLGGSVDYVTRPELDKIIDMLAELKSITLHLNPYMRLIAQKWSITNSANVQEDIRYFEKASDEIQSAARSLANMILENNQSYELDRFVVFLREFSDFTGQDWPLANQIERGMPVIKKVKKAISGGNPNSIGPTEWKSFVLLGARGYLQYLRYHYFIKSASDTGSGIRLGYLARSMEDLMGAFQDLVQQKPRDPACGGDANSCISKQEIADILKTFSDVWPEFQVSDKLVDEAMKIKKVYFGGSENSLTSGDFERGKNKVAGLKLVVEKFLPYYPVYSFEWDPQSFDPQMAQQFYREAQANLQSSAELMGNLFEEAYDMENVRSLLTEIDRLYPNAEDPDKHPLLEVLKFLPLAKDVKNIVFSENDTYIKKSQWAPFLKFSARFYDSYLYHYYFMKNETYGSSQFLEAFKKLADRVLAVTRDIVMVKKNQLISVDELQKIAWRLVEVDMLPKEIRPRSLEDVLKVVLNRLLWPTELRLKGSIPNGLTPVSVDYLKAELQIWYETESYLYALTESPRGAADLQKEVAQTLKHPQISAPLRAGLTELALVLAGPVAQTVDKDGRLVISNILKRGYDTASVGRMNLDRAIGRALIRASITDLQRLQRYQGVELKEAQVLFDQVRPLTVELGLLEPDNLTFMESRFREANIFTAHSNGDSYVNFPEMADIVGMIISGVTVNNSFRRDVVDVCTTPARMKSDLMVSEKCFRKVYLEQTANYMTATPEYVKFFKKMELDNTETFLQNILKAAGHIPNKQGTVKLIDADLAPHVIQYIEMTLSKYDADKNGIINLAEARKAYPSFHGILKELTKDQNLIKEKDLLALFTYILHYGKPPGGIKDYVFKWLPWKRNPEKWTVGANREDLAGILGYIADQVAASQKKAARFFIVSPEEEGEIRRGGYERE